MTATNVSQIEILENLEYILEVLAKNYIGEAKTELSTLLIKIDSCQLPSDLVLKLQCSLIEGRNNISGANFDVPRSSHYLWDAYKLLKSHIRQSHFTDDFKQVL